MDEKEKRSLLILLALALVDESRDDNIERQRKQWATYVIIMNEVFSKRAIMYDIVT